MVRRIQIAFLLCIVICAAAYTGQQESVDAVERPSALLLYPNATDVWSGERGGSDQLAYHVHAKFPASGVIGWICYKLQEAGWEALTYDFLNPNLPSSRVQGWQQFPAGLKNRELCVHLWLGSWKDVSGNIVTYAFRYKQPCSASNPNDLEVVAGYYPAIVARQLHDSAEQLKEKLKAK